MKVLILLIPFIVAFYLSGLIIPYIYLISYRKRLFDPINKRKLHDAIVPRLGGVAFAPIQCVVMTVLVVFFHKYNFLNDLHIDTGEVIPMFLMLVTGLVILFLVGLADDLIGVSYKAKFFAQLLVAAFLPFAGLWLNDMYGVLFITWLPAYIGMPLTVLAVMTVINAVNLIDGLDGLCSGVVMVGCIVLGVLFAMQGAWLHAAFGFTTAGMLFPFFYFNVFGKSRKKRRIFMGDTGSLTLGFSVAFLAISYAMNNPGIKPFFEGAIVIAFSTLVIPLLDVVRVMVIRYKKGKPLFIADNNHIHHLLLRLGLSHRQTMVVILLFAVFFSVFNIIGVNLISNNIVLALDLIIWLSLHIYIDKLLKKKEQEAAKEVTISLSDKKALSGEV